LTATRPVPPVIASRQAFFFCIFFIFLYDFRSEQKKSQGIKEIQKQKVKGNTGKKIFIKEIRGIALVFFLPPFVLVFCFFLASKTNIDSPPTKNGMPAERAGLETALSSSMSLKASKI
jgi:hypothetical protein